MCRVEFHHHCSEQSKEELPDCSTIILNGKELTFFHNERRKKEDFEAALKRIVEAAYLRGCEDSLKDHQKKLRELMGIKE